MRFLFRTKIIRLTAKNAASLCHIGKKRDENQDAVLVEDRRQVYAVFDGMGGAKGGAAASSLAREHMEAGLAEGASLVDGLRASNEAIRDRAKSSPEMAQMGSTAVALRLSKGSYEVVWCGDSRAYRMRGRNLVRLTRDHSLVQDYVDRGVFTEEEAEASPQRSRINRCLGGGGDFFKVEQKVGTNWLQSRFLLCSDGLTCVVGDAEIENILSMRMNAQTAVDALLALTMERGAPDNVSIIVVDAPGRFSIRYWCST